MRVTVPEDYGWLRSHDDAAACLRAAAPGARVEIYRPPLRHWAQRTSEKSRAYRLTLERVGHAHPLSAGDAYALPCPAENLERRVRELIAQALNTG